ncbi:hypothetical protein ACFPM7_01985 [Actinokineospora guangxiensis]|uniref:Uncharacterized protein n=1 Tax=Actinokineospora guangxiensis TaxID=1490288 RepID=A0ABW0EIS4_9PSEU
MAAPAGRVCLRASAPAWNEITDTVGSPTPQVEVPSTIRYWIAAGHYPCRELTLGGRYDGCGYVNADGWILLPDLVNDAPWAGFVISACTNDV